MNSKPLLIRITTIPLALNILLSDQMKYMKNQGYEVIMISSDGKEIPQLIDREECPHLSVPFTRKISPLEDLKCLFQLIRILKKKKPDIIHTHTPKAGLLGMLAGKICGVKLKIHTIAGLPLMTATGIKRNLLENIEKLTYWAADFVLPNSSSIMDFVQKNKFTSSKKLEIIGYGSSNGIDLQRFSKKAINPKILEAIKKKLNYNSQNRYIISIGRVVKDKGVVELIDAFLQVKKVNKKTQTYIAGSFRRREKRRVIATLYFASHKRR